ncbi:hypothetical protein Poly30_43950 [Planctomycetes bacterium Poly30]|uniref:Uncharacterized protein n=1 Tax=Saltatorellus ferox TaxID=2528018 RepID=A0A518EXN1_9BACT|nr:hypothetical protein Poly30_43950 [Planctomycetes bacterium Poly30]
MQRNTFSIAATCLAAISLSTGASAQYSESFESYTAPSAIEGQGGWQNWDVCATGNQLFNTVTTAQAATGTKSLRLLGSTAAGGTCAACSDTTHELNGPYTSGEWTFKVKTWIPNTFAGDAYVILMNTYNNCGGPYDWSTQIRFSDSGQVIVDAIGGTNYVPINGNQPILFDQWGELKVEIDLNNNTVVFSYNDVEMSGGDWAPGTGVPEIKALDLYPGSDDTTEWFVDDISLTAGIVGGPVGTNYCMANPNSTGGTGVMGATGSRSVTANDLTLQGTGLPNLSFGFFITSNTSVFVPNPGGSSGNLCVGGAVGRYVGPGQIKNSGLNGTIELLINNQLTPTPTGFVQIQSGETRFFQLWHRDSSGGTPTSNFTDGYEITFN